MTIIYFLVYTTRILLTAYLRDYERDYNCENIARSNGCRDPILASPVPSDDEDSDESDDQNDSR